MRISIPIYVEEVRTDRGNEFQVRPLFFPGPVRRAELLSRAMNRLTHEIRTLLERAGKDPRHDELQRWALAPEIETAHFKEKLLLRHRTLHCRFLLAAFDAFDRRIAFSPSLPDVWFDIAKGESLHTRASEVYTAYFREEERDLPDFPVPRQIENFQRGSVTELEIEFTPAQKWEPTKKSFFAALFGEQKMDGQEELHNVGRRLDSLFPDDLERAMLREPEVAELTRLMNAPDRRPILLVGPRMVGKTTIVQEYVCRRLQPLPNPYTEKHNVWLLAPQRLISGMMYVGQWENRLLAILDHAKKQEHVLYFDDLLGLYQAGISANSNLSVAHVLRPYIERRDVQVLAEITPEGLSALQERDRGFADLFHLLPVREPSEPDARRLLLAAMRHLEGIHNARFGIDVLPTTMELQQRYVRDLALPGKVANFLKDLATKFKDTDLGRHEVLSEFHTKSGLSVGFLDRDKTLDRAEVLKSLTSNVTGQSHATEAMADVVAVAKSQLNDPGRPFGSFLFLGPTGVGKTQAAKALARYLFGDADRLLRFDMNEFVDPWSAARLVGTWSNPEGVLTSAVRRQPFSVILLDEIEKAHPDVFDLLLQVLGEGRLSDSLGRTSDFSNTIIIMTSNLGVREAGASFGFSSPASSAEAAYRAAAEQFFRPEFFNRIDRIVPFRRLTREETRTIAQGLIDEVLHREGLQQRRCMLSVTNDAMETLVDQGYHPDLGARALKRAINRELVQPVAGHLAAIEPGTPTLLNVYTDNKKLRVHVRPLHYAETAPSHDEESPDPQTTLDKVDLALERIHHAIDAMRPDGTVVIGSIRPEHAKYFALREQFDRVERLLAGADTAISRPPSAKVRPHLRSKQSGVRRSRIHFRALLAATDLNQYLLEINAAAETPTPETTRLDILLRELALIQAMLTSEPNTKSILLLRALVGSPTDSASIVKDFYLRAGAHFHPLPTAANNPANGFLPGWLEHPEASALFHHEAGIHLVMRAQLLPVEAIPLALAATDDLAKAAITAISQQAATPETSPSTAILRLYKDNIFDLRTRLIAGRSDPDTHFRDILIAQCPLPLELGAP